MELELLLLPKHLSASPVFSGVGVTPYLVICVFFLQIAVCPFVLFLVAIVLSVLLRYTDSDYPFGIFEILEQILLIKITTTKNKTKTQRQNNTKIIYMETKSIS